MKILKQYIPTGARHKLLFTSHHAEGMNFVDIGALLARAIESSLSNRHLSFVAEEELEKIIKANVCHSSEIGDYIAIRNIGILFESALRLDLHAKFSTWSKAYVLIVDSAEGTIQKDIFYLAGDTDSSYRINLSDISYKIHYDEI